jgi:hypothetical protein
MIQYRKMPLTCNLCLTTLEDALISFKRPHRTYEIHVGKSVAIFAQRLHHEMYNSKEANIFAPAVNIVFEPEFGVYEWCLSAEGEESVGSGGF